KWFEDRPQKILGNGRAIIVNRNFDGPICLARAQYRLAFAIAERVCEQVRDGLVKAIAIPFAHQVAGSAEIDAARLALPKFVRDLSAQLADVHALRCDGEGTASCARVVREVLDHLRHPSDSATDSVCGRPQASIEVPMSQAIRRKS